MNVKSCSLVALIFVLLSARLMAQQAHEQLTATPGLADSIDVSWSGYPERTYFLQFSNDLLDWQFAPLIEQGAGESINWSMTGAAAGNFFRLVFTDLPTNDPENEDFDADGLGSWDEIAVHQTHPLRSDTDGDGLGDGDEVTLGTNPMSPDSGGAQADADEDGVPDANEPASGQVVGFPDNPLVELSATIQSF